MATISGTAGNDLLDTGISAALASGRLYDGGVELLGLDGDDRLTGGIGDVLQGGNGADVLMLRASLASFLARGRTALLGADGDDVLLLSGNGLNTVAVEIDGGAGADIVEINLPVIGGTISGRLGAGADTLRLLSVSGPTVTIEDFQASEVDSDTLLLPAGSKLHLAQQGADAVLFDDLFNNVQVRLLNADAAAVGARLGFVSGSEQPDRTVFIVGGNDNDGFQGGPGADAVAGLGGADTLNGGEGDDLLLGSRGADQLTGGPGADTFLYTGLFDSQRGSQDTITDFETGIDRIVFSTLQPREISIVRDGEVSFVFAVVAEGALLLTVIGSARDVNAGDIVGYAGGLFMLGGGGGDVLLGSAQVDNLQGRDGDDQLRAGEGADLLVGGAGADQLTGGSGADIFFYFGAGDSRTGAQDTLTDFQTGTDAIELTALAAQQVSIVRQGAASFVFANTPSGALVVGAGADVNAGDLRGFSGGVYLLGSGGRDTLRGGAQADTLHGLQGGDALLGGAGADRFIYGAIADSTPAQADTIFDFQSGVDKLDLTALRTGAGTAVRTGVVSQAGATFVFVDVGADGSTDMLIQLAATPSLASGDILV